MKCSVRKIRILPPVCRLHNAVQAKQKDKQAVGQLEKRLKAEQEARATAEKQLADEKKRKKLEEATAARAVALAAASRWVAKRLPRLVACLSRSLAVMKLYHSVPSAQPEGSAQTRCGGASPN